VKHGIHCGTRSWSADGVHGKFSHHALGDRHESGAKSGAREPACFSRIVPAVLESTRRGNACSLRSFNRLGRMVRSMKADLQRTCPSCGNEFSGAMEFCPVCMLRKGLAGGVESGESSFHEAIQPTSDQPPKRFEHYELVTGEGGKPVELGRGAMGVTYKAFDVDLRCPVTLKVISERYVGDQSAQPRPLSHRRIKMQICTSIPIEKSLCKFAESSDRVTDLSYTYPLADESSKYRAHGYTHVSDSPALDRARCLVNSHGPPSNCA
jgi:hypothetical protein